MLSCRQLTEQASSYIDQEMDWQQRLSVRTHLLLCRNCRRFIRNMRRMKLRLRRMRVKEAPAQLLARIDLQIQQRLAKPPAAPHNPADRGDPNSE